MDSTENQIQKRSCRFFALAEITREMRTRAELGSNDGSQADSQFFVKDIM